MEPAPLLEVAIQRLVIRSLRVERDVVDLRPAALGAVALGPRVEALLVALAHFPRLERDLFAGLRVDERRRLVEVERSLGRVEDVEHEDLVLAVAEVREAREHLL